MLASFHAGYYLRVECTFRVISIDRTKSEARSNLSLYELMSAKQLSDDNLISIIIFFFSFVIFAL